MVSITVSKAGFNSSGSSSNTRLWKLSAEQLGTRAPIDFTTPRV